MERINASSSGWQKALRATCGGSYGTAVEQLDLVSR